MVAARVVCCGRIEATASPAALVGAWLVDVLSGIAGVELVRFSNDVIMLHVPLRALESVRGDVVKLFNEPRCAGWRILSSDGPLTVGDPGSL